MNAANQHQIAAEFGRRLGRFCERCELTGDLRRGAPSGPDRPMVEFVCVPKMEGEESLLDRAICGFVESSPEAVLSRNRRFHFGNHYRVRTVWGNLRIWVASPKSFGACWLYTTGSAAHIFFLCERARALHAHLAPFSGLWKGLENFGSDEEGIYRALSLDYTPPRARSGESGPALEPEYATR